MAVRSGVFLPTNSLFHERYRIVRGIKAGAMGAVHEARDERTNSPCALKTMLPGVLDDETSRTRFEQEAKITGEIRSDHIVRVTDAGCDDTTGMPFLVMELLHGEELGSLIKKRDHIPIDEALVYLTQVAFALDKAHAASIVHRDLKPGNLFLTTRDDGSPCVKILDFGIAKLMSEGQTHATQTVGTPMYMAPEQIIGKSALIGAPTDILSLAHITYTLLTGESYWHEEAKKVGVYALIQHVVTGPEELPTKRALRRRGMTLPDWFDAWFAKATANHPEDRFQRATEAMAEFKEQYQESGPQSFRMGARPSRPSRSPKRPAIASQSDITMTAVPEGAPSPEGASEASSTSPKPVEMDAPVVSARTVRRSRWVPTLVALTCLMSTVAIGLAVKLLLGDPPKPPLIAERAFSGGLPPLPSVAAPVPVASAAPASAARTSAPASSAAPSDDGLEFHTDAPTPTAGSSAGLVPASTSNPVATAKTAPTPPTGTGKKPPTNTNVPPGSID
jgi:serine/threonine protein kinase